jgi:hypothetical protein
MTENIKAVQNPLTVIAIFAALAEVAGTIALATVDHGLQHTFVWFVMAFPTCLVLLFFATLNFNPKVLYAPSDFKDEENFLNTLAGGRVISESFDDLTKQLDAAKRQILAETLEKVGAAGDTELKKLAATVNQQLELLRGKVELTRESAIETTLATAGAREIIRCEYCKLVQFRTHNQVCRRCKQSLSTENADNISPGGVYPRSKLQAQILDFLLGADGPVTSSQIAEGIGWNLTAIQRALDKLTLRGLIVVREVENGVSLIEHV